ncbi:MAG: LCP family protein [Actinobacteria bacterium]|nr:LCP family protein [Actinomycetota bacterium]
MSKVKGCFIAFIAVFIIGLIIVLLFALSDFKQPSNEQSSSDTQVASGGFGGNNFLFLGVEARDGLKDFKGRTDTIIIYHMAPWGQKDCLISIPRDARVQLEEHGWNKINAAYVYGKEKMLKDEIYQLTQVSIDRTMLVNFEAFKKIIDALGGVKITVDVPLHDSKSGANFDPGTYVMNGEQALSFARDRSTAKGDFDRADRQKYLLSELIKQKVNLSLIIKAPQLLNILNTETKSDFSIFDFAKLAITLMLSNKNIERITIPGKTANIDGVSYVVVNEKEVKEFLGKYIK